MRHTDDAARAKRNNKVEQVRHSDDAERAKRNNKVEQVRHTDLIVALGKPARVVYDPNVMSVMF